MNHAIIVVTTCLFKLNEFNNPGKNNTC